MPVSAVAIFCEDIREEQGGQNTIVGTLPDNLVVQSPKADAPEGTRAFMGKLAIFVRVNFAVDDNVKEASVKLLSSDDTVIAQGEWDRPVIEKAINDSKKNNMPLVGLIFKVVAAPFPLKGTGRLKVIATIDGSERIAGALNIIDPAANASPPPA